MPSGSGNYVQNSTTQQANANFNISGNGTIGTNPASAAVHQWRGLKFSIRQVRFALTNGTTRLAGDLQRQHCILWYQHNHSFGLQANNGVNGGLFLENTGNIGVGTIFPNHKLTIDTLGGPGWTTQNWGGAIALRNSSAIGWQLNNSSLSFGIGQSTDGLSFFRTSSSPGTTANAPVYEMQITNQGNVGIGTTAPNAKLFVQGEAANGVGIAATGNAAQSADKGGWIKAMIYVRADGTIARCFNGVSGATASNCGFALIPLPGFPAGFYQIDVGFNVASRFLSITVIKADGFERGGKIYSFPTSTAAIVHTFRNGSIDEPTDFFLIIY